MFTLMNATNSSNDTFSRQRKLRQNKRERCGERWWVGERCMEGKREKKRARESGGGGEGGEERTRDAGIKHQRVSACIHAATHCNTLQ